MKNKKRVYIMKQITYFLTISLIFIMLFISFCAKEPKMELEKAEKAYQQAIAVKAQEYATDYFEKAEAKLESAKKLINSKKYSTAVKMLEEVESLSLTAVKKAEARKKQEEEKERKKIIEEKKKIAEKKAAEQKAMEFELQKIAEEKAKAKKYIVKKGDNLWKIASKKYGKAKFWKVIYEANKEIISDFDKIFAGQELIIPNIESNEIKSGNIKNLLAELPKRIIVDEKYTVRVFDNLWDIAKDLFNDPLMWKSIYELNKNNISQPCKVFPKQVLIMPSPKNAEIIKTE